MTVWDTFSVNKFIDMLLLFEYLLNTPRDSTLRTY